MPPSVKVTCLTLSVLAMHITEGPFRTFYLKINFFVVKEEENALSRFMSLCLSASETRCFDIISRRCLGYWINSTVRGNHIGQQSFIHFICPYQCFIQTALASEGTVTIGWKLSRHTFIHSFIQYLLST